MVIGPPGLTASAEAARFCDRLRRIIAVAVADPLDGKSSVTVNVMVNEPAFA
jgi:hypothetical protein